MKEKLRLILLEKGNYDMKIAILGAGRIAVHMAETLAGMDDVEAYAVGARELERAEAFAEKYGFTKAYGSYEEMLADKEIDLVYIATPHSHHYKHAKMCLEAGKNVLCEKSFTVNANQARALFKLAEEKNLLITEAIWTRYMPSRKIIQDIVESGVIGEVTSLTANLSYAVTEKESVNRNLQEVHCLMSESIRLTLQAWCLVKTSKMCSRVQFLKAASIFSKPLL